jgi:hypothetical protein
MTMDRSEEAHAKDNRGIAGVQRVYVLPGDSLNGFTDALRRDGALEWVSVIFILEFVILSGVWRGFLRQTQSKDPEQAHTAPTLRPFLTTHIARNF